MHDAGQREQGIRQGRLPDQHVEPGRRRRPQHGGHLQDDDERGGNARKQRPPSEGAPIRFAGRGFCLSLFPDARCCFHDLVSGSAHRCVQAPGQAGTALVAYVRALGGQVDVRRRHAVHAAERFFDAERAGGARHAPDSELYLLFGSAADRGVGGHGAREKGMRRRVILPAGPGCFRCGPVRLRDATP